jgi:hypothetical protein
MENINIRQLSNADLERWSNRSESLEEDKKILTFKELDEVDIENEVNIMKKMHDENVLRRLRVIVA